MASDETAAPADVVKPTREPPSRPWLVVALAAATLLAGAVALEWVHRASVVEKLGRPPQDWSDPQVRALSQVGSLAPGRLADRREAWRHVAEMRPAGDVTSAAWTECAISGFQDSPARQAQDARRALEAAPDDSPRIGARFRFYGRTLQRCGDVDGIATSGRETIHRATVPAARTAIASAVVRALSRHGRAAAAVATYEEFAKAYPEVAGSDGARCDYGAALAAAGRRQEAIRVLRDVLNSGAPEWRAEARRELEKIGGAAAR